MIQIDRLSFGYGTRLVLQHISTTIERGEIFTILGPNGSGKTTLLRLLRGVLTPVQGQVNWSGNRPAHRMGRRHMAQLCAVVPQSLESYFEFSVEQMVCMGRYAHRKWLAGESERDAMAVQRAMALSDTLHLAQRPVSSVSGGERQRVYIARALAQQAPVLMLDEATSNMDMDHRLEMTQLLQRLNANESQTVVQVSHDLDMAAQISHRIMLLGSAGSITALGSPRQVLTPANLKSSFGVEVGVEENPYTGAPRIIPIRPTQRSTLHNLSIHVIGGGGSASGLLRRLHMAGAQVSTGPLNRGDSDHVLAQALGMDVVIEEAFVAFSAAQIAKAHQLAAAASTGLVIAPCAWGHGNLVCLDMARQLLLQGTSVWIINPRPENDYTGGSAWQKLQELRQMGATVLPDTDAFLELLRSQNSPDC
ncbi:ABC transporter ATP-binding protein [Desulfurispira natronophila]|uniref:Iron complex transport system ATP-binding protein n=1 Tax=Desulfurispira natronophila TaxID=682562 RepID=A0A7W7Y4V0_9BACT|nr:ABC transporter ATP-binding protein [Desulfurispira natronophila]MBB5022130.1 iron complex transport system ATP-binding protein [Desulfurispira natronophila]